MYNSWIRQHNYLQESCIILNLTWPYSPANMAQRHKFAENPRIYSVTQRILNEFFTLTRLWLNANVRQALNPRSGVRSKQLLFNFCQTWPSIRSRAARHHRQQKQPARVAAENKATTGTPSRRWPNVAQCQAGIGLTSRVCWWEASVPRMRPAVLQWKMLDSCRGQPKLYYIPHWQLTVVCTARKTQDLNTNRTTATLAFIYHFYHYKGLTAN